MQLMRAVAAAKAAQLAAGAAAGSSSARQISILNSNSTSGGVDLWALGCELRARYGYLIKLRRSLAGKGPKAYLRSLRHSFLVVRGIDGDQGEF